jgi:RNA polymerase sigma-70 factor (ECF subfamily)
MAQPKNIDARESVSGLLAHARAGDRQALDRLLEICRNYVVILARSRIPGSLAAKADASDLVQQTLFEAFRGFGAFRGQTEGEWLAWLRRILGRNAIDLARKHAGSAKGQGLNNLGAAGNGQSDRRFEPMDPHQSPSAEVRMQERDLLLAEALTRLSPEHREVILLRNLEGLAFAEVAERMGRSRPAAQMLWMRALRSLQELLAAESVQT